MASRCCRIYVGVIALLAFHVQKDSGVTSYYLNGLRSIFHSVKSENQEADRGHSINCFSCSSKRSDACLKPDTSQYTPVHCDWTMTDQLRNLSREVNREYEKIFEVDRLHSSDVGFICLKVEVEEGTRKYVLRGCQLELHNNLDICKKVEKESTGMYKLLHCSKCDRDDCNSSMGSYQFSTALILSCLLMHQAISKV